MTCPEWTIDVDCDKCGREFNFTPNWSRWFVWCPNCGAGYGVEQETEGWISVTRDPHMDRDPVSDVPDCKECGFRMVSAQATRGDSGEYACRRCKP